MTKFVTNPNSYIKNYEQKINDLSKENKELKATIRSHQLIKLQQLKLGTFTSGNVTEDEQPQQTHHVKK